MRPDREIAVRANPEGAIKAYEEEKRNFKPNGAELPTDEACRLAGSALYPLVMLAYGWWDAIRC